MTVEAFEKACEMVPQIKALESQIDIVRLELESEKPGIFINGNWLYGPVAAVGIDAVKCELTMKLKQLLNEFEQL